MNYSIQNWTYCHPLSPIVIPMQYELIRFTTVHYTHNEIIAKAYSNTLEKEVSLHLYPLPQPLTQEQLIALRGHLAGSKKLHKNIIKYQHIEQLTSAQIDHSTLREGQTYLAFFRGRRNTLTKVTSLRMTLDFKQKISLFLGIAKAVRSLHRHQHFGLGLQTGDIYLDSRNRIKINDLRQVIPNPNKDRYPPKQMDVWRLAVVFVEIVLEVKLRISWDEARETLRSIRALLRQTHEFVFYPLRRVIKKMLRWEESRQMGIQRVVRKLKRLDRLGEEELRREKVSRVLVLPLVDNMTADEYKFEQIRLSQQRIIIVEPFEIFLTLINSELIVEVTHTSLPQPLISASFTPLTLPPLLRSAFPDLPSFFQHLQTLQAKAFKFQACGHLSFPFP